MIKPGPKKTSILELQQKVAPAPEQAKVVVNDDFEFLRWLDTDVWKMHDGYNSHRGYYKYRDFGRVLTLEEWVRVQAAIKKHALMVGMYNYDFAFGIGICVYHEAPNLYPGVKLEPEELFQMKRQHVPKELITGVDNQVLWKFCWDLWEPLVYNEENLTKLRWHGMDKTAARPMSDYVY